MAKPKSKEYREHEMELILSLAPSADNIRRLSAVLGRSASAIQLVYRAAFGYGAFPEGTAFNVKVLQAKNSVGIQLGRRSPRSAKKT